MGKLRGLRYGAFMLASAQQHTVGDLIRSWRQRRRLSQLELAILSDISARHLSFVETGRACPSRTLVLRLAKKLSVPLREQNHLLLAAGYAPTFSARDLSDPALTAARNAVELILKGHEPYPALAIDRRWNLLGMNGAVGPLLAGVAPHLLAPPVNVLRLSLHPRGLAPRIVNLAAWREHLLARVTHGLELTADETLAELLEELRSYPVPNAKSAQPSRPSVAAIAVPLCLETTHGTLSLISTTTVFGTPTDVTLSELALETFFPADPESASMLQKPHRLEPREPREA